MRITFVAPFGLGQKTTIWARTLPLARHLVRRGCAVTVLIPPWDTPQDAGKIWVDEGVRVVNVALAGRLPTVMLRLLAEVRRSRPAVVHIVKPRAHAGLVQWLLWHWRRIGGGARLLLDVDDWEQAWSALGAYPRPLARFLDWQERWGIAHADGVTAASHWLVGTVQAHAPGMPVLYLPNGVSAQDGASSPAGRPIQARREQDPPCVLFFSRFIEVDPAWMGAFWQALRSLRPDVHLLVGGRALQAGREQLFRDALAVERTAVEWLGYVEPAALADLYARADCAIFPAADTPLNQAKCSVRLATTLLGGVPVVASAVGEQARYGAHGAANLVPADATPQEFAQAVADLLVEPAAQRTLAAQAREQLLREYDWARLGDRLYAYYRSFL